MIGSLVCMIELLIPSCTRVQRIGFILFPRITGFQFWKEKQIYTEYKMQQYYFFNVYCYLYDLINIALILVYTSSILLTIENKLFKNGKLMFKYYSGTNLLS